MIRSLFGHLVHRLCVTQVNDLILAVLDRRLLFADKHYILHIKKECDWALKYEFIKTLKTALMQTCSTRKGF